MCSVGLIWITQASCGTCTMMNRGDPEKVFEIRVAYAGMEPRYRTTSVLSKSRLIDLDVLSSSRRVSCA
jgi:hypothetical protein